MVALEKLTDVIAEFWENAEDMAGSDCYRPVNWKADSDVIGREEWFEALGCVFDIVGRRTFNAGIRSKIYDVRSAEASASICHSHNEKHASTSSACSTEAPQSSHGSSPSPSTVEIELREGAGSKDSKRKASNELSVEIPETCSTPVPYDSDPLSKAQGDEAPHPKYSQYVSDSKITRSESTDDSTSRREKRARAIETLQKLVDLTDGLTQSNPYVGSPCASSARTVLTRTVQPEAIVRQRTWDGGDKGDLPIARRDHPAESMATTPVGQAITPVGQASDGTSVKTPVGTSNSIASSPTQSHSPGHPSPLRLGSVDGNEDDPAPHSATHSATRSTSRISNWSKDSTISTRSHISRWNSHEETLIVFDWDDTLCPTTFLAEDPRITWCEPLPCFDDPSIPLDEDCESGVELGTTMLSAFHELEQAVSALIREAASVGTVVVLTLAREGWVDMAIKNFFPGLRQVFDDVCVQVVYARSALSEREVMRAAHDEIDVWTLLKTVSMKGIVSSFYSERPNQSWKNIVSIGDSEAERSALQEITFLRRQPDHTGMEKRCRCKTVKLQDSPDIVQLNAEVEVLHTWMRAIAQYDGDICWDLDQGDVDDATMGLETVIWQASSPSPGPFLSNDGTPLAGSQCSPMSAASP